MPLPNGILGTVLSALKEPSNKGAYWLACCPAHEDDKASLSIKSGADGRVLLNCFAGCTAEAIAKALGMEMKDLFPSKPRAERTPYTTNRPVMVKSYDYVDERGNLAYQVCRYEPKDFRPRRPDGKGGWVANLDGVKRYLYRLPDVLEAVAQERTLYIVEGEKDADALSELGYAATTWAGGAKSWREEYANWLQDATVALIPDNDDPGREAMNEVAASLANVGAVVKIVTLPDVPVKGDVSDWLDAGGNLDQLDALTSAAPVFQVDPSAKWLWSLAEMMESDYLMRPPPPVVPRIAWASRSTLLAAREKAGKSTLTGYIAARVSDGGEFLGDPCEQGNVLIVGLEEFAGDAARRLKHFHGVKKRIFYATHLPGEPSERPQRIRDAIERCKPSLVIVDSLIAYGQGRVTDFNQAGQIAPIVNELTRIAHETGVALILIHHAKKDGGGYRDSTSIGGAVDVIVEVFTPNEDADPTLRRARGKGRTPVPALYDFRFDGNTYSLVGTQHAPLDFRIADVIRDRPGISISELCKSVGGRWTETKKIVDQMLADRRLLDEGEGERRRLFLANTRLSDDLL